jgi:hypothetical protein
LRWFLEENNEKKNTLNNSQTEISNKSMLPSLSFEDKIKGFRKTFEELNYKKLADEYPDYIQTLSLEVDSVISEKVKDSDAVINVKLKSSSNESFNQETSFYLHKESDNWKIFKVTDSFLADDFLK